MIKTERGVGLADFVHGSFIWNEDKFQKNLEIHGVDFLEASEAFFDPDRVLIKDHTHSQNEERFYCLGLTGIENKVITVRFTYRDNLIRIFGAGYWRKGRRIYEKENL
jgi:uncharacterized protein